MIERLGTGWSASVARPRAIGNIWLSKAETAVFQVPSALVPETWNYLLNPLHVDALLFSIEQSYEYPFDERPKN
jgi:RES domain-containing protein